MVTLGETQIEETGSVNVYDILNELPQAGEGISRGNTNFTVGSSGLQTVNLRGLGSGRTLTLVNGRRWVGGVPGTGTVDLNSIPTDLIERLEVITGGASSVYGSDAVAGVVNIILKDDFEGLSIEVMEGGYDAGDGDTAMASVTFGSSFADGRGSAVFNIRSDEQGAVFARDRTPWTGRDKLNYGYYAPIYGVDAWKGLEFDPAYSSYPPQGRFMPSGLIGDESGMLTFDCSQRDIDSVVKSDTVVPWGGSAACGFNRTHYRALEVPLERYQVYSSSNYDFDNGNKFWTELSYSSVDSTSQFEPVPFNSEDMFGGLGHYGYNVSNPYMPAAIRDAAVAAQNGVQAFDANGNAIPNKFVHATDFLDATGNVLLPAGHELQVPFIRRLADFGTRGSEITRQTFRASMGLEGTLANGYEWDAHYSYGFSNRQQISGAYNAANFAYAVNAVVDPSTGNIVCADPIAQARNCVPINVFGIDAMSPEAVDYVRADTTTQTKNKQRVASFNITGDFNLLGLDASFAAGMERREERSTDRPDALQLAGLHGGNKVALTTGEYSVNGYYAELLLPLYKVYLLSMS